jgi:hypothetical protein
MVLKAFFLKSKKQKMHLFFAKKTPIKNNPKFKNIFLKTKIKTVKS